MTCEYCGLIGKPAVCSSVGPARQGVRALCTRESGHSGDHVACGMTDHEIDKWHSTLVVCPQCNREFPDNLLAPLILDKGSIYCCALCALSIRNKYLDLPLETPFEGKMAASLHERCARIHKNNVTPEILR